MFEWHPDSNESGNSMMVDEDYMDLMSDTLFSSITQPFPFPNPREIGNLNALFVYIIFILALQQFVVFNIRVPFFISADSHF